MTGLQLVMTCMPAGHSQIETQLPPTSDDLVKLSAGLAMLLPIARPVWTPGNQLAGQAKVGGR